MPMRTSAHPWCLSRQSRGDSLLAVGQAVCLCIIAPGVNVRFCRVPRVCVGQLGWRLVMVAGGGPVRARVSARRSASGSRYRPAMRRTRSAASAAGIPAEVTNSRRTEDPRRTGAAWVAVRNLDLAAPITGMPNSACTRAPRPGRPGLRGPDRRSHRPPAGPPPRSDRAGSRAAAAVRAGRTRPAGRAVPVVLPRCVRPARARRRHRRPGRLPFSRSPPASSR